VVLEVLQGEWCTGVAGVGVVVGVGWH